MKNVLHIISTPRKDDSRTLKLSSAFLDSLRNKYSDLVFDELNLFEEWLPAFTARSVQNKYDLMSGQSASSHYEWKDMEVVIERFLKADLYVFSVPMWNFSIPYILKQFLDVVIQPGYCFRYSEEGPVGLVEGTAVVFTSRGGDYSEESGMNHLDMLEPYLKQVLEFIGLKDPFFINAQPMDAGGDDLHEKRLNDALVVSRSLVDSLDFS